MPKAKIVTDLKNNYFTNNKFTFGTAQPSSGTYVAGDIVINKSPSSTAYGWLCTASGSPGSWKVLKSANDLPPMSWGNISGKPSTFSPVVGTSSTTAYRGDYGNIAYNHSKAAHAPSNAQRNADITKAEIEAKLTGIVSSHSHNYAAVNHGNHVPNKETANNVRFLRNDNTWADVNPYNISGVAHYPLPNHLSGAPEAYIKICSLALVPTDNSHCEILLSGNGNFGSTGHSFGILRASGRGSGSVKYLRLMNADDTNIEVGYIKSSTAIDVWIKRPAFDGVGAMTVLGVSPNYCTIFKNPYITATKPSGYQVATHHNLFDLSVVNRGMCLENNYAYKGGTTNYGQYNLIGVDTSNNISLGWGNQTYINVYNTMRVYRDLTVSSGQIYASAIRAGSVIKFGPDHVRFEYSKDENCIYVAGSETELYGYHRPFRARAFESVENEMVFGSRRFSIGSQPGGQSSVWFRV